MCPLCLGCWALPPLGAFTHFYEGSNEGLIYSCCAETRRMGASRVEVMSWASQPQSGILVHSHSHHCLLAIAQHLHPSASRQSVLFPELLRHAVWAEAESVDVHSRSFTEGSCDSYDEWVRSCEEARIRWGGEEAMTGIASACLAGLELPSCLGQCERQACFQSWVLAVHSTTY